MKSATAQDRRAALLAGIDAAATTDKGMTIAKAIVGSFGNVEFYYRQSIRLSTWD
jgi:hypothetical protein